MWMWAALPLPSFTPWPSNISTRKPPERLYSPVVSSQSRQPPGTQNDHPEAGVVGQAVLTAFKSNVKHPSPSSSSSGVKTREQPSLLPGQQRPLSGSDVLRALKRATAKKTKKKKKDVSVTPRAPKDGDEEDKSIDYSILRPLTIKSEWSVRLEQLEKRLDQLMDA